MDTCSERVSKKEKGRREGEKEGEEEGGREGWRGERGGGREGEGREGWRGGEGREGGREESGEEAKSPYLPGPEGIQELLAAACGAVPVPAEQQQERAQGHKLRLAHQRLQLLQLSRVDELQSLVQHALQQVLPVEESAVKPVAPLRDHHLVSGGESLSALSQASHRLPSLAWR